MRYFIVNLQAYRNLVQTVYLILIASWKLEIFLMDVTELFFKQGSHVHDLIINAILKNRLDICSIASEQRPHHPPSPRIATSSPLLF